MAAKESKNQVRYSPRAEKHSQRCALCVYFIATHSQCQRVAGQIRAGGWCEIFEGQLTEERTSS
jgi:hypothetical protein